MHGNPSAVDARLLVGGALEKSRPKARINISYRKSLIKIKPTLHPLGLKLELAKRQSKLPREDFSDGIPREEYKK